ncbi:MAG: hypothetical protein NUV98_07510, partial [Candidatus Roizmanbacteria bacterium]|nr:hypothetical protein [Candidatus Roizmanbacteria bacterium]
IAGEEEQQTQELQPAAREQNHQPDNSSNTTIDNYCAVDVQKGSHICVEDRWHKILCGIVDGGLSSWVVNVDEDDPNRKNVIGIDIVNRSCRDVIDIR